MAELIDVLEETEEEAEARESEETESLCTNYIEEDGIYEDLWESNVFDALVDFGLLAARVGLNVGRKQPKYRHPYTGQDIYYSIETLVKAQAEDWAAWGVNVGDLRRRQNHRSKIRAKSCPIYHYLDRAEIELCAQIEAYEAWGINAVNIKRKLRKRIKERTGTLYQHIEEYFSRMTTPFPLLDEKLMTNSCPDLHAEFDDNVQKTFPLRYALSLPAGLDFTNAHEP